jgi:hypothetical protein
MIIAGILSICQEPNKNARRVKACRPTYSPIPIFRSFSRNKRGIAGSLVWVNFDRHGLLSLVWKLGGQFVANVDDVRPQFSNATNSYLSQSAIFQRTLVRGLPGLPPASASINALNGAPMTAVDGLKQLAKPWYSDQILPFDITLAGASELGAATAMKIYGVEILNEGSGVSIVAEVTKIQATFVARTRCSGANDFLPLAGEGRGRLRVAQHGRGGGVLCAFCCSENTSCVEVSGCSFLARHVVVLACQRGRLLDAMTVAVEAW